ncbi:hypothetical protein [Nocardia transvalensis]|uniref:hypothetical protein n=1 Tax=Nocardia transvalensis TaxID=37333 RepID=UPI001895B812|nr:hypothetical protein [Nocardia transvalensis]MBF6331471.1 hypothetical protein [Nocardia transvalensis]
MSEQDTAEAIQTIRSLVSAQNLREAKQQLRQLRKDIDDPTWLIITEIAHTLRFKRHDDAIEKLRDLWSENEPHRALIEACVPKADEGQYIPEPTLPPFGNPRQTRTRASRVVRRVDPTRRSDPFDRPKPTDGREIERYEAELDVDARPKPGQPRPKPIVDRRDYDVDAAADVKFSLCVSCRLERAAIDHWTGRVLTGHGDDGLCGDCRTLGCRGIPDLPLGHTHTQAVEARLEFLAEQFDTHGRGLFRQEWYHADNRTRPIIARWVKQHTEPDQRPPASQAELTELNGECEKCGEWRQLRDALCVDCHPGLDAEAAPAGSIAPLHAAYASSLMAHRHNGQAKSESQAAAIRSSGETASGQPPAVQDGGTVRDPTGDLPRKATTQRAAPTYTTRADRNPTGSSNRRRVRGPQPTSQLRRSGLR